MSRFGAHGPQLQAAMFDTGAPPRPEDVDRFAEAARNRFSDQDGNGLEIVQELGGTTPLNELDKGPGDRVTVHLNERRQK